MSTRPSKLEYQKRTFKSSYTRFRTYESLLPDEKRRCDIALLETDVPLVDLSKRFSIDTHFLHDRLKVLGFKVQRTCRETNTQERVKVA